MTMSQTPRPDPEQLLARARREGGPALGELLELYRHYLHLLARAEIGRRLQSRLDPSDLVQEAFLAAQRDFAAFRGTTEAELVAWLRQVLAARMADQVRRHLKAKRRDVRLERRLADELAQSSQDWEHQLAARQSSPSTQAARRERAVLLAEALKTLPAAYEEVIVLRHLEGLSFAEVADRMGRSVDSVEKLWVRALAHLRRALGDAS
jgi:RNA polymerase sigma-70 factor (ECF subfamily)